MLRVIACAACSPSRLPTLCACAFRLRRVAARASEVMTERVPREEDFWSISEGIALDCAVYLGSVQRWSHSSQLRINCLELYEDAFAVMACARADVCKAKLMMIARGLQVVGVPSDVVCLICLMLVPRRLEVSIPRNLYPTRVTLPDSGHRLLMQAAMSEGAASELFRRERDELRHCALELEAARETAVQCWERSSLALQFALSHAGPALAAAVQAVDLTVAFTIVDSVVD